MAHRRQGAPQLHAGGHPARRAAVSAAVLEAEHKPSFAVLAALSAIGLARGSEATSSLQERLLPKVDPFGDGAWIRTQTDTVSAGLHSQLPLVATWVIITSNVIETVAIACDKIYRETSEQRYVHMV